MGFHSGPEDRQEQGETAAARSTTDRADDTPDGRAPEGDGWYCWGCLRLAALKTTPRAAAPTRAGGSRCIRGSCSTSACRAGELVSVSYTGPRPASRPLVGAASEAPVPAGASLRYRADSSVPSPSVETDTPSPATIYGPGKAKAPRQHRGASWAISPSRPTALGSHPPRAARPTKESAGPRDTVSHLDSQGHPAERRGEDCGPHRPPGRATADTVRDSPAVGQSGSERSSAHAPELPLGSGGRSSCTT